MFSGTWTENRRIHGSPLCSLQAARFRPTTDLVSPNRRWRNFVGLGVGFNRRPKIGDRRSSLPVKRMARIIVRTEEETSRDVEIAVVDQSAIDGDERVPVSTVEQRYPVPGNSRPLVMQHMEIVVEKQ